jgi:hypothetical protein
VELTAAASARSVSQRAARIKDEVCERAIRFTTPAD